MSRNPDLLSMRLEESRKRKEMSQKTARTFTLNQIEEVKAEEFKREHTIHCTGTPPRDKGYTYQFGYTGIGVWVKIRCESCLETEDVTDYYRW
jgi:hypothetical protein